MGAAPRWLRIHKPSEANPGTARRLLVVSYHFPPAPEVGGLRWARMIPLLAAEGWGADVITADAREAPRAAAAGLLDALPPDTAVLGVQTPTMLAETVEHALWRAYRRLRGAPAPAAPVPDRDGAAASADGRPRPSPGGAPPAPSPGGAARRPVSLAAGRVGYALGSPRGWLRIFWARLERRRYRLWARRAARAAAELHHERTYAAVVVSTPPHWSQAAGAWIKASAGIPFVADLRDPWAATAFLPESVASGEWLRLARRDERSTVAAADLVLANTEAAADWLRGAHPRHAARIAVVRNGWDDDPPRTPERRRFRIVYAGSIYGDRSPEPIFRAIASLRRRRTIGPDDLRVEVMGKIDPGEAWLRRLADAHGLADVLRVEPPGPRADADALMARAAVLVSLPWSQDLAVPAKVYEFMRFEAWPLVLAGPDSAPARLLEGTGAIVADPSAPDHIAAVLESLFDRWRAGDRPGIPAGRESLSRRSAVRDLVAHLDGLPARRRGEPAVAS